MIGITYVYIYVDTYRYNEERRKRRNSLFFGTQKIKCQIKTWHI